MTAPTAKPKRRRFKGRRLALTLAVLAVIALPIWYLNSARFDRYVRQRIVTAVEQAAGGRAEIGALRFRLWRLHFEIDDLTVHGTEAAGQAPFLHVDQAAADMRILSLFGGKLGLRRLELVHPAFHLVINPDGTTNRPAPLPGPAPTDWTLQELFRVTASRLSVRNGVVVIDQKRTPFDFEADNVAAGLEYSRLRGRYRGQFSAGRLRTQFRDFLPLDASAKLEFLLWPTKAELSSFAVDSGRSHIQGKGEVSDFRTLAATLDYAGVLDLGQLGRTARIAGLRGGMVEFSGKGSYTPGGYATSGKLSARDFAWEEPGLSVSGMSARADYNLTPASAALTSATGTLLGGGFAGDLQIRNWQAGVAPAGAPQKGTAHLRVQGVSLAGLIESLGGRGLPLARMDYVGALSGTLESAWMGAPGNMLLGANLEVVPPEQPRSGQAPVTARLRGVYHGQDQSLEIEEASVATLAMRAGASGTLGTESSRLQFSSSTADLGEWRPLLALLDPAAQMPAEMQGRASFDGTVRGKLSGPSLTGTLEADEVDALMEPEPGRSAAPWRLRWDQMHGDLDYSPSEVSVHHGKVVSGKTAAEFDVTASLHQGRFLATSPFRARLSAQALPVSEVEALAGWSYPITGTLDTSLEVSGTRLDPRGSGSLHIVDGTIYGERFRSLRGDLRLAGQEVQLNDIALAFDGARLGGSAAYQADTHAIRFDVQGTDFDLAEFQVLQSRKIVTTGKLGFTAQGSGTTEAPAINARVQLRDLVMNGERVGGFDVDAVTRGADMRISGRSAFARAQLSVDGMVHLRDLFPADLTLKFTDLDFDPLLLAYLPGKLTGHSSMAGTITLQGPLKDPKRLEVAADIPQLALSISNLVLRNDGPIRFHLAEEVLHVEPARIVGEGTDLSGGGTAPLAAGQPMDVRANGEVNLRLLRTFDPDLTSSGLTTVALQVAGTRTAPEIRGQVHIEDGAISYIDLPNGLSNVNGTLVFNQNRLVVRTLSARTGGGDLALGGFISYSRGLYFNLTATGKDIRLRYPQGISSTADASLRFQGTPGNSLLSGDIVVTRFGVNPQFDLSGYLARAKETPSTPTSSPLNNIRLDVHVTSTPELQMQSSMARLSGSVDLHLRGTALRPVVLGRVDISAGEISFVGTKYRIDRGDLVFTNPVRIEPVVDMETSARVRDYDISLGLHGPLDRLSTTYRSDPPLPPGDIVALLALGRTQEEVYQYSSEYQSAFSENASNAILNQALSQGTSSRMQKLFGVSRVKIDPQVGGPENNPNARLTIEQQVSDKVTLTYITNLAQSQQQIIQVEYNLTPDLSVVAIRDQNGVAGMDIRLRRRRR